MKIQTKEIKENVIQITTSDERWYKVGDKYIPSVTWICGHYPKGIQFYKWLAQKGWDESQAIKNAAGDKGSKVHHAIEDLISGKEVGMSDKYFNESLGEDEELTVEEYDCLISFAKWFEDVKPKTLSTEITVISQKYNFAGTVDYVCEIDGKKYVVDFKTSANIWPEYELQISAYKHALIEMQKPEMNLAILQVGYNRNKKGYKFTEIEDKFDLFLSAQKIWANETAGQEPLQKDYPLFLKLNNESKS